MLHTSNESSFGASTNNPVANIYSLNAINTKRRPRQVKRKYTEEPTNGGRAVSRLQGSPMPTTCVLSTKFTRKPGSLLPSGSIFCSTAHSHLRKQTALLIEDRIIESLRNWLKNPDIKLLSTRVPMREAIYGDHVPHTKG